MISRSGGATLMGGAVGATVMGGVVAFGKYGATLGGEPVCSKLYRWLAALS